MDNSITRLYPLPTEELPLKRAYIDHKLRDHTTQSGRAFLFSNFITSLDGRIAVPHPTRSDLTIPDQITNKRDWRLFQELAVQADVLITSGRYLRDYAEGRAQELLTVYDDPRCDDLKTWRTDHGLAQFPDMAVISGSLDFPIPQVLTEGDRSLLIFTTSRADPEHVKAMETQHCQVIVAGDESVQGDRLAYNLTKLGYHTVFSTAGPKILHMLVSSGALDRLYLTFANRLLGGSPFSSVIEGDLFDPPANFHLTNLYLDPHGLEGSGQLFATYDRVSS